MQSKNILVASETFFISKSLENNFTGVASLDKGGSLIKILYLSPCLDEQLLCLTCETYPINGDYEVILTNAMQSSLFCTRKHLPFMVTGVGVINDLKKLEDITDCKVIFKDEILTLFTGLAWMFQNIPKEQLLHSNKMPTNQQINQGDQIELPEFPNIHIPLGSAGGGVRMEEDGTFHSLGMDLIGGKTLLCFSAALLGITDYDELMLLAEIGDCHNIDDPHFHSFAGDNSNGVPFGRCLSLKARVKSFQREDIAASIVNLFAIHFVQLATGCIGGSESDLRSAPRMVYFSGNTIRSAVMRRFIMQHAMRRMVELETIFDIRFVRTGHHCNFGLIIC